MSTAYWIFVAILLIIIGLAVWIFLVKSRKQKSTDYYALFAIGLTWLPLGIPLKNYFLSAMGLVFIIVGLANRNKWRQTRKTWSDLTKREKFFKIIIISALAVLILACLIIYFLKGR